MTAGLRSLLVVLAAVLTLSPTAHDLTAAAVLAALVLILALATASPRWLPVVTRHWVPLAHRSMPPLLRQAVVAGPGRPQPRAPGAPSRATT